MPKLVTHTTEGSLAALTRAHLDQLVLRTAVKKGNGSGVDAWASYAGDGGMHRLVALVNVDKAAAATIVLDSTIDWRDRIVSIFECNDERAHGVALSFPGMSEDVSWSNVTSTFGVPTMHFTKSGVTVNLSAGNANLQARSSDGALVLTIPGSGTTDYNGAIWIVAGERTGHYSPSPTAIPGLVGADGDLIVPADLNYVQDASVLVQMRGNASAPQGPTGIFPTGRRGNGSPFIPFSYPRADGSNSLPSPGDTLYRFIAGSYTTGADHIVDTTADWRDRVLHGFGVISTTDIVPGSATDTSFNASNPWFESAQYTGPGNAPGAITAAFHAMLIEGTPPTAMGFYARSSDGALILTSDRGGTRFVGGILMASYKLGPRST